MKFNIGDPVIYSYEAGSKTYTHFGIVKMHKKQIIYSKGRKSSYQIFFPKEDIYMWISEDFLTLQPRISREDLL